MEFGKASGGGRRCAQRTAAPVTAVISTLAGSRHFDLVDLSTTGARLRGPDLPRSGTELMLSADRVRAYGSVVWNDFGQCGIEFEEPVDHDSVEAVRTFIARAVRLGRDPREPMEDWMLGAVR